MIDKNFRIIGSVYWKRNGDGTLTIKGAREGEEETLSVEVALRKYDLNGMIRDALSGQIGFESIRT